jgi:cyclic pyranopterin phosphate synthase
MLRRDIETLVAKLARVEGLKDLALTTNAYNLAERAAGLKAAGLDRVTVSLDSLKRASFTEMTGVDMLSRVLEGIRAAQRVGLTPVKVNAVIVRGHNEGEVADMAAFAREHGVHMRFIEYMPLDSGHGWSRERVVSGAEIRAAINERFLLVAKRGERGSETATRYRFADGAPGEIGIIAPVTEPFCGACSRVRLTADGQIRTCLFSKVEQLCATFSAPAPPAELADYLRVGRQPEGAAPLHQRDLLRTARAHDEPHRRLTFQVLTHASAATYGALRSESYRAALEPSFTAPEVTSLARDAERLARHDFVRVVADYVLVGLVDFAPRDAVVLAYLAERVAGLDRVGLAAATARAAADLDVHDEVARAHVGVYAIVLVPELLLRLLARRGAGDVEHVALFRDL